MKSDVYTKLVLTLIAGSLVALVGVELLQPKVLYAAEPPEATEVRIVGLGGDLKGLPVVLAGVQEDLKPDATVPVQLQLIADQSASKLIRFSEKNKGGQRAWAVVSMPMKAAVDWEQPFEEDAH